MIGGLQLSPDLGSSAEWSLLYGQGERLKNTANFIQAMSKWVCFKCSDSGVWCEKQPCLMSKSMSDVPVQRISLML